MASHCPHLKAQLCRELDRFELLDGQIKAVETSPQAMLAGTKGIGAESANILASEGLFRQFDNRRQVAAYTGLALSPWRSGSIDREQGVSKAGNPRLRTTMIQLAWLWLRYQPDAALTRWFHEAQVAGEVERSRSSRWRASCSLPCGST